MSNLWGSELAQLNALLNINNILPIKAKFSLVQSFVYAHYCQLVWHFSNSKSPLKVEKLQKRALRFLHNNSETSYGNILPNTYKNVSIYR